MNVMKIGNFINIAALPENKWEERFRFSREIDSDFVELTIDYPHGPFTLTDKDIQKLKGLKENYDLEILIHAPFTDINPSSLSPKIHEITVKELFKTLHIARKLNSNLITIHGGKKSIFSIVHGNIHEKVAINTFKKIERKGRDLEIIICLENLPKSNSMWSDWIYESKNLVEIIRAINSEYFKITFDIGHANTVQNPIKYFERIKNHVEHIHCHDSNTKNQHLQIGKGNIEFIKFFKRLKSMKYDKTFSLEVFENQEIKMSKYKIEKIISKLGKWW